VAPPPINYDKLIREGLRLIAKADEAVILSALPLDLLEGLDVVPLAKAIQKFDFVVEVTHKYHGRMSQAQHDYLQDYTDSMEMFGKAVALVAGNVYNHVFGALAELKKALEKPTAVPVAKMMDGGGIPMPILSCCYLDGQAMPNVPQDDCIALQGQYSPNPCPTIPPMKPA
jgi:hypothetical protein